MVRQKTNLSIPQSLVSKDRQFTLRVKASMDFAYQVAGKFLQDPEEIKDAIQSAYIKAWKAFDSYSDQKSQFTTWLYSILRNECIDRLRKYKTQVREELAKVELPDGKQPEEEYLKQEMHQQILILAENLPPSQKEIFLLRDLQGYSIKEVIEITGTTEGSIKTNLYHARQKLRSWILEQEND